MSKQLYLPESTYTLDSKMNHKKLKFFYENNYTVTGKVTRLNSIKEHFEVYLGEDLIGIMPFSESTIYPIYNESNEYTSAIYALVGKTIRAKITEYDGSYHIILSRKENMEEALEYFKNTTEQISGSITGFSQMSAFLDIGSGIIARSYGKNFCNTIFKDIQDVGIKKGELVSVKILYPSVDVPNKFEVSRVETLPKAKDCLNPGDLVTCKVFSEIGDNEGYYVLIDDKFCGIIDSPDIKLEYGDEVIGIIKKIRKKGVKLNLVERVC